MIAGDNVIACAAVAIVQHQSSDEDPAGRILTWKMDFGIGLEAGAVMF